VIPRGAPGALERRRQRAATIGSLLRSIASFVIYGTAFVLILGEFGVNLAPIIASAGVIGVAVGFGAQNLIKDFGGRRGDRQRVPPSRHPTTGGICGYLGLGCLNPDERFSDFCLVPF
jgi:hypothetical protein